MHLSRYTSVSENSYLEKESSKTYKIYYNSSSAKSVALEERNHILVSSSSFDLLPPEVLSCLAENKFLTQKTYEEEIEDTIKYQKMEAETSDFRSFILLPTQWCNLGCDYCGQSHFRLPLSSTHRRIVKDRVLSAIRDESVREVSVGWFGAEPLVAYRAILDMSEKFIDESMSLGCRYTSHMVTNGSLLTADKIYNLVEKCRISRFDITIDGTREVHDSHRPSKNPGGSFNKIIEALKVFKEGEFSNDPTVIIRTNLDNRNFDDIKNLIGFLEDSKLNSSRFEFNIAPVYSWSNDVSKVELTPEFFSKIELEIFDELRKSGFSYNVFPDSPVGVLCSAVTKNAEVVSATGNIFSCTEYPLVPEHEKSDALTHLVDLGIPEIRPLHKFDGWLDDISKGKFLCRKCKFLPVCGGSCPKQWHSKISPCPSYKYDYQSRLDHIAIINNLEVK